MSHLQKPTRKGSFLSLSALKKKKPDDGATSTLNNNTKEEGGEEPKKKEQDRKGIFSKRRRQAEEAGGGTLKKQREGEDDERLPFPGIALYTASFANPKLKFDESRDAASGDKKKGEEGEDDDDDEEEEEGEENSPIVPSRKIPSLTPGAFIIPDEGMLEQADMEEISKREKTKRKGTTGRSKGKSSTRRKKKKKSKRYMTEIRRPAANGHHTRGAEVAGSSGELRARRKREEAAAEAESNGEGEGEGEEGGEHSESDKLDDVQPDSPNRDKIQHPVFAEGKPEEPEAEGTAVSESNEEAGVASHPSADADQEANGMGAPNAEIEIPEIRTRAGEETGEETEQSASEMELRTEPEQESEGDAGEEADGEVVLLVTRTIDNVQGENCLNIRVETRQKSGRGTPRDLTHHHHGETFVLSSRGRILDEPETLDAYLDDALQGVKEEDSAEPSRAKTKLSTFLSLSLSLSLSLTLSLSLSLTHMYLPSLLFNSEATFETLRE